MNLTETHGVSRRAFLGAAAAAAAAQAAAPAEYPLYRVRGTHREMGRQHGEQAASKIKAHLEVIQKGSKLNREQLRRRAARYQPMFDKYCPHLLEEMRGIAEGAGVTFEEAMACSIRGGVGSVPQDGCTAYAIGRGGMRNRETVAGQNSDMDGSVPPLAYVLHLKPNDKPEVLMWTFGGMLGYHGMNSEGVAHFANALGGGPGGRFAMPHYPVKRLMLECRTVGEVASVLSRVPLASNGNYVVCDGKGGLLDVEATTAGPEFIHDNGAGFLAHTNHFVCPRYATKDNHKESWPDSFPRMERISQLVKAKYGTLEVADIQRFLRDHEGKPTGICRHDGDSITVASLIAETAHGRMHVAAGNPCRGRYQIYSM